MSDADEFFLATLEDLRANVSKRPPRKYEFAHIGLLLRQLLLDGDRLVDVVNHKHEKIRFRVPVLKYKDPKVRSWTAQGFLGLFDSVCSGRSAQFLQLLEQSPLKLAAEAVCVDVQELDLQRFLKVVVSVHEGEESTIRDLIDYASNVFGGAHFLPEKKVPRKPSQKLLVRSKESLSAPYPLELGMLLYIGGIVLRGLETIEANVRP
jgi:hypothetical protein